MLAEALFAVGMRQPLPSPEHRPVVHHQTSAAPSVPAQGPRAYALAKVGPAQFACLDPLWRHESGWRPTAANDDSSAYGIPQLLHLSRSLSPRGQVDAGLRYIDARYGSPCSAWQHWQTHHWY